MNTATTLVLPANLAPYVDGIMIGVNDLWDKSLIEHSEWTQIQEKSVYPFLYKYVYSINTGTELWALGSQEKLIFTAE